MLVVEVLVTQFLDTFVEHVSIDRHMVTNVRFITKTEFLGFNGGNVAQVESCDLF